MNIDLTDSVSLHFNNRFFFISGGNTLHDKLYRMDNKRVEKRTFLKIFQCLINLEINALWCKYGKLITF